MDLRLKTQYGFPSLPLSLAYRLYIVYVTFNSLNYLSSYLISNSNIYHCKATLVSTTRRRACFFAHFSTTTSNSISSARSFSTLNNIRSNSLPSDVELRRVVLIVLSLLNVLSFCATVTGAVNASR